MPESFSPKFIELPESPAIIVTRQQLVDFIGTQLPDRQIKMEENIQSILNCGCVMVHYGKEVLGLDQFWCGANQWFINKSIIVSQVVAKLDKSTIWDIVGLTPFQIANYGELQQRLKIAPLKPSK